MSITASQVAELREKTGAGLMDAKRALEETGGDMEKAAEDLRKKGIAKAGKKSERETHEGRVHAYIHSNAKLGAMVQVLCETDFVARTDAFIDMCNDLAIHISAMDPMYLTRSDVPAEVVMKEQELTRGELAAQNKPADVIEKIMEGKMNKFFGENVLMEQAFIKDDSKTVEEFLKEKMSVLGENMQIKRFSRFSF
ncbi:elongation factor Ts [Candidatus Uhrbacteria bacterium RIFCSPHIGHO2_02_FULL_47_44]|uniref:Elongation factor Ts n=1 Tax=Candidatus Uhrbacteria bacterium RIFCSPLOWO2_02_FULL_48_18 TaxID=1802408 RepID=A0A1F7V8U3_9BACT|nr:MAG: elongation factor Ts [Candidatus Uhrbacteria bacterium RIFCSPHIGHO2_01_FULL_47_10]OGL69792.1 MAG: elongation factor Ts [Candidatus Uhrbacteria bacterium RIFCSPHIGHO2_02_FULL_47_44]OGL77413.1 MAG: elongation factor Ts [Candidatus Uhrbacteria bacterium RIFCSPHIGHO2_12_FULL_47_12]OGL81773.1 MAG: elongation factor Ts [Candidatus Uhrbacteria bacterium RIFCSPLOWO2_01_FULL_47_17]OGL86936.1 MAG: elongation factor Ts [Candidatus Uhrbacteria bacterium RIFCSPLOWO2_02_FULL_48_18]OGL94335.1 MAG: el